MKTRIVLEVETGLAPEEVGFIKQLLRDAIGEFITARSGRGADRRVEGTPDPNDATVEYVRKRYPDLSVEAHLRKVDEVRLRKAIARRLRRAVDDVTIEQVPVPVAERTCEVLPTVFAESVEDEAKRFADVIDSDLEYGGKRYPSAEAKREAVLKDVIGSDLEYDMERLGYLKK